MFVSSREVEFEIFGSTVLIIEGKLISLFLVFGYRRLCMDFFV